MVWAWLSRILSGGSPYVVRVDSGPSRLAGKTYEFWSGHLDWLQPAPSELDAEINALCAEFEAGSADSRAALTQSLNAEDTYAFQHFALRSAVIGLRSGSVELLRRGLISAAAISPNVRGFRSAGYPLPRLYYSLARCGVDASSAFVEAEQLACDATARWFRAHHQRYANYSSLDELCKREQVWVVATQQGPGFVEPSIESFEPSYDLIELSLRVAELLRAESRYQFNTVRPKSKLPEYWIWGRDNDDAERMKPNVAAVCEVQSRLRPEYDKNRERSPVLGQWLDVYLVEMNSSEASQSVAQAANRLRHDRAAMLAVALGPLVAIAFALKSNQFGRTAESTATLERFREPLSAVLRAAALRAVATP